MSLIQLIRLGYVSFILAGCGILNPPQPAPVVESSPPVVVKPPALKLDTQSANAAYVAEGNGRLYLCTIDSTNKLTRCNLTGTTEYGAKISWLPNNVMINAVNGVSYAYIISAEDIFICSIAQDKNLTNCHSTGSSNKLGEPLKWLPTDIEFQSEGPIDVAYITGVRTVYKCSVDSNGGLVNCDSTGNAKPLKPMHWLPNGLAINRIGSNTYAYIAASNLVYECLLDSSGSLTNCSKTGVSTAKASMNWHPNDIVFTAQGSGFYGYVADPYSMYVCNVDASNGELLNCIKTGSGKDGFAMNWLPNTLVFNRTTTGKLAYVVGVYNVFLCDAKNNGTLTNCQISAFDSHGKEMVWNPKSIYLVGAKI